MIVRRRLPYVLALVLGIGTALLTACGGGTASGIPAASAGELKGQIDDVRQAADGGRCSEVPRQLKQVDQGIDDLPASTASELVSALRNGADKLRQTAIEECDATPTTTDTTPTDTTTDTTPTDTTTDTTPADTTTLPPVDTTTTPPVTVPTTPPPVPTTTTVVPPTPEPAPLPPAAPPATPGGGTRPEIPPA
jgi:cell division protein FtsN